MYSDARNDSSAIIFLPNANIIHTTRTCVNKHKMVLDIKISVGGEVV